MINTSYPDQVRVQWYCNLWEEESFEYQKKMISLQLAEQYLSKTGFKSVKHEKIKDIMYDRSYYDVMDVKNKEWRDRDSFFALVTEERLQWGIE